MIIQYTYTLVTNNIIHYHLYERIRTNAPYSGQKKKLIDCSKILYTRVMCYYIIIQQQIKAPNINNNVIIIVLLHLPSRPVVRSSHK